MNTLRGMWDGLDSVGRTVLVGAVALIILAAIVTGFDLGPWILAIFGQS